MRKVIYIMLLLFVGLNVDAQTDLRNIVFSGKVHENSKGIAGVPVTDGYNIVLTDSKGEYKLQSNATVDFIYITIPSGYTIPIDNDAPCFYKRITDKSSRKQQFDFALQKSGKDETKHILVACADPQVGFDEEMPILQNAVNDMAKLVKEEYAGLPVHGLVLGDMVEQINNEPKFYEPIKKMFADTGIPFFYTVGNHDMDVNGRSNHYSKETYKKTFGPAYYSFNRGKVHYITLDDVFFVARSYLSIGYIEEEQLNWFQQDLALVPAGSTVIVSFHIPSYSREARRGELSKEAITKVLQNRRALYQILEPYNVHILSGHEHYNENYIVSDKLYEHVHSSLCGLFWQAPCSMDGTPIGYAVYEIDGGNVKWYYKTIDKDRDFQFNAYPVGASRDKPDAITANIWNYDPAWKIYWYEDGIRMGEMQQYTGYDPTIYNYVVANEKNFKYKYIGAARTEHIFFAEPKNKDAAIKVEAIDRFGNSYIQEVKK